MLPSHFLEDTCDLYGIQHNGDEQEIVSLAAGVSCRIITVNSITGFTAIRIEGGGESGRQQYQLVVSASTSLRGVEQVQIGEYRYRVIAKLSAPLTAGMFHTLTLELHDE